MGDFRASHQATQPFRMRLADFRFIQAETTSLQVDGHLGTVNYVEVIHSSIWNPRIKVSKVESSESIFCIKKNIDKKNPTVGERKLSHRDS